MIRFRSGRCAATAVFILACGVTAALQSPPLQYPATRRGDVVAEYHGTWIPDPYRWMEDLDSKDAIDWIAAQNAVTFDYLQRLPMRETLRKRITELWDYPKTSLPVLEAGRLFYRKNRGLEKQSPLYMRAGLTAAPTLLIDPNTWSPTDPSRWRPMHPRRTAGCWLTGSQRAARTGGR